MTPFMQSLEIDGFKAVTDLRVDGLRKVNLITGKNNSAKSSLLEAISETKAGERSIRRAHANAWHSARTRRCQGVWFG